MSKFPFSIAFSSFLAAGLVTMATVRDARAQQSSTPAPPPAAGTPAAPTFSPSPIATAAMLHIYDLSLLRSLQPVKLTHEQLDALLPIVRELLTTDIDRRKKDEEALLALAGDLAAARTDVLAGQPFPTELEKRVEAMNKEAMARKTAARQAATGRVLAALLPTLTDVQKEELEVQSRALFGGRRVPAKYRSNPAKAPKAEVQELAVRAFIENVLLDDRTLTLLERMRSAAGTAPAPATGAPAAPPAQP